MWIERALEINPCNSSHVGWVPPSFLCLCVRLVFSAPLSTVDNFRQLHLGTLPLACLVWHGRGYRHLSFNLRLLSGHLQYSSDTQWTYSTLQVQYYTHSRVRCITCMHACVQFVYVYGHMFVYTYILKVFCHELQVD